MKDPGRCDGVRSLGMLISQPLDIGILPNASLPRLLKAAMKLMCAPIVRIQSPLRTLEK
jgi:hypothetical protein